MARTPAQQKHPLLNGATTALSFGVIALVIKVIDTVTIMSRSPNANPLNVFLDTGNGVGGTDMGRLVPLWGTLLIPLGIVLLVIYLVMRRGSQPQMVGGQQQWQQPQPWQQGQPDQQGQQWGQQPGQQAQAPQQWQQPAQPQAGEPRAGEQPGQPQPEQPQP